MNGRYYKVLKLNPTQKKELIFFISEIEKNSFNLYPVLKTAITWAICKNVYNFAAIPDGTGYKNYDISQLTWDFLTDRIPDLNNFIERYGLIPAFGYGTAEVPVHRHVLPKNSGWTITVLLENTIGGTIEFFNPSKNEYNESDYEFHHNEQPTLVEKITIDNELNFYSLYARHWHAWNPPNSNKNLCHYALFHFDDSESIKSIDKCLMKSNILYE